MKTYNCAILARNKIIEFVVWFVMLCYVLLCPFSVEFFCCPNNWTYSIVGLTFVGIWSTIIMWFVCLFICLFYSMFFCLFIFRFVLTHPTARNFALCLLADVMISVYCYYDYSNYLYTLLLAYIIQAIELFLFTLDLLLAYCLCLFNNQHFSSV